MWVIGTLNYFMDDEMYEQFSVMNNEELEYFFENNLGGFVDGYGMKNAIESFHMSGATTGQVQELTDIQVKVDGRELVVTATALCEKKDAQIELILSNDSFLRFMGAALNPVSTKGELMKKAALNTVLGMGTVFIVLILISLIIACFGIIPVVQKAFAKKGESVNTAGIDNAVAQIAQQEEILEEADDTELVAVIAAAIAAYEGSGSTDGFVVRSIRRR